MSEIVIRRGPDGRFSWTDAPAAGFAAYVALGRDGDVLYVGQSSSPRTRLQDHPDQAWWRNCAAFVVLPVSSALEALMAEAGLIERLHPIHNRQVSYTRTRVRNLLAAEAASNVGLLRRGIGALAGRWTAS